jgi:DNA-directed RNA polymerase specialized sigma24 family protein
MSRLPERIYGRAHAATDAELLRRASTGDREAFAALYDRLAPVVYGSARRVIDDPALAEEVTQDVLLRVWSSAAAFDAARGSVRVWVMSITCQRVFEALGGDTVRAVSRDLETIGEVRDMVWDLEMRAQRNRAMEELQQAGFTCDVPPRRLGARFAFRVAGVPEERRQEVAALVLRHCPSAMVQA